MNNPRQLSGRRKTEDQDDEESFVTQKARSIIRIHSLTAKHLQNEGMTDSTLYHKLKGYVLPDLHKMPVQDLVRLAVKGTGMRLNLHHIIVSREPPKSGNDRTTMLEVHGHSEDWLPADADGISLLKLMACTAVIARIHDLLNRGRKAIIPHPITVRRVSSN